MKAILQNAYGEPDVLELKDIDEPAVKDRTVLVRVHAAALNAGDVFSLRGKPWAVRLVVGFLRPKNHVPGWDMAGRVEAVGKGVTSFRPGDEVYGACGRTLAEYVGAEEKNLAMKPSNISFDQAAVVPTAALTALQGLRDAGKLRPGQRVLVNGASGGVGTFAVQIAKALGADVTGVCSPKNVDMVRSIGADRVIDYTQEDFTQGAQRYDLILDNVGNHSFSDCRRALTPGGRHLPNTGQAGMGYIVRAFVLSLFIRRHGRPFIQKANPKDLAFLTELIEGGKVKPVIDRTYRFAETPEAFRYMDEGHARGKVVISIRPS